MKKLYVLRNDMNEDYVRVFTSITKAVAALAEEMADNCDFIDEKEVVKLTSKREKERYTYLLPPEIEKYTLIISELE